MGTGLDLQAAKFGSKLHTKVHCELHFLCVREDGEKSTIYHVFCGGNGVTLNSSTPKHDALISPDLKAPLPLCMQQATHQDCAKSSLVI